MGRTRNQGGTVRSILQRDRKCWICKRGVSVADASRDHVNPRSMGGYNKARNYRLAHKGCNSARGSLPEDEVIRIVNQLGNPSTGAVQQALREAWRDWLADHRARQR